VINYRKILEDERKVKSHQVKQLENIKLAILSTNLAIMSQMKNIFRLLKKRLK